MVLERAQGALAVEDAPVCRHHWVIEPGQRALQRESAGTATRFVPSRTPFIWEAMTKKNRANAGCIVRRGRLICLPLRVLGERPHPNPLPEEREFSRYRIATGLTGEPVPPTTRRGFRVSMKS